MVKIIGFRVLDNAGSPLKVGVLSHLAAQDMEGALCVYGMCSEFRTQQITVVDPVLQTPQEKNYIVVDAEHTQGPLPNNSNMMHYTCTLASITAVKDGRIISTKTYTNPERVVGNSDKAQAARSHLEVQGNGQVRAVPMNGGIYQFRLDVKGFIRDGYKVYAKGVNAETHILADTCVTYPMQKGIQPLEFGRDIGNGLKEWARPKADRVGPNGFMLTVHELGGTSFDILKKHLAYDISEDCLRDIYDSGYRSINHHPAAETYVFALHCLLVKKFPITRTTDRDCYSQMRLEYHRALHDWIRFRLAQDLSFLRPGLNTFFHPDLIPLAEELLGRGQMHAVDLPAQIEQRAPGQYPRFLELVRMNPSCIAVEDGYMFFKPTFLEARRNFEQMVVNEVMRKMTRPVFGQAPVYLSPEAMEVGTDVV
jgi:hypothetical protein